MSKPLAFGLATFLLGIACAQASTSPTPAPSPSTTPSVVAQFNGSIGARYDRADTPGNRFNRIQDSVVFGFTITSPGVVDLVGMIQTGAPYGKKWDTAIDFLAPSKNPPLPHLYFKQIYLQKSFHAFGMPATAQAGILATNQKIGTQSFLGPVTALGTNGWSEGARISLRTRLGDLSVTGGSIFDRTEANVLNRDREMNYVEIQVSRKVFDALTLEASGGQFDGSFFVRGAVAYDIALITEHVIRLVQEAFYSDGRFDSATALSTDLGALFDEKMAGRINIDLRYSYISPDMNFRGQAMNDLVLKGHVFSSAIYGKVDKSGRLNWFAAKDFIDAKRVQTGITWKFKGGNPK